MSKSVFLPNKLLSPAELSDLIGVPTRTLADWRLKGAGPGFVRCGHAVRYDPAIVAAWLSENTVGGVR